MFRLFVCALAFSALFLVSCGSTKRVILERYPTYPPGQEPKVEPDPCQPPAPTPTPKPTPTPDPCPKPQPCPEPQPCPSPEPSPDDDPPTPLPDPDGIKKRPRVIVVEPVYY